MCSHKKKKSFIFLSPRHFLFANGGSFVPTQEKKRAYFLRKLRNFKENSKMIGFDGEYPTIHPKTKFWRFLVKNCKKSAVKHSIEKHILLNFVNLSSSLLSKIVRGNWFSFLNRSRLLDFTFSEDFSIFSILFKMIFKETQLQKMPEYDIFQKNTILDFSVKYEFGTTRCSSCSRAVFVKWFYFYLLKTDHFLGCNCIVKQVKTKRKIFRQSWTKH